jgi:hypothetical protein
LTKQIVFADIADKLEELGYMNIYRTKSREIAPSYFIEPWGIHGVRHAKRVLMLSLILSYLNKLNFSDTDILVQASLYHDIGRTHNGVCYEHGYKSYKKMLKIGLVKNDGSESTSILKFIVENHCVQDADALKNAKDYHFTDEGRAIGLLKIFKDSDGLDRVRLGDLNVRYLRNEFSAKLVGVAEQLLKDIE